MNKIVLFIMKRMSIFDLFSSDPQKRIEADRELGDLENNIHERTSKISFATIVSVFLFVLLPLFSMLKMGVQDFRTMGFFLVIGEFLLFWFLNGCNGLQSLPKKTWILQIKQFFKMMKQQRLLKNYNLKRNLKR